MQVAAIPQSLAARRFLLRGLVQGLGVRPAIFRLAMQFGLAGQVRNTQEGVEAVVEGLAEAVAAFSMALRDSMPAEARLEGLTEQAVEAIGHEGFAIECEEDSGPLSARIPPERAVCDRCLGEVFDDGDRRHRYPFTSCTECGPRYTVLRQMPYERADTSMADFPFCPPCEAEYTSPASRRFHAQTNACATCGPTLRAVDANGNAQGTGERALRFAMGLLRAGQIVAVKGVGGYQLLVDATEEDAVRRLRQRKHRPAKPLAVMVASLAAAQQLASMETVEEVALRGPANPIVLLRAKANSPLAPSIHAGLRDVGLLLPTTPLHALLLAEFGGPLVCTSGNREGDPLAFNEDAAEGALAGICDGWLHHNREIVRPLDDSVVRVIAGRPVTIRLARGLAPLPLTVPVGKPLLALGGHQKSSAAWSNGRQAVLGPHLGDLDSVASRERWARELELQQELYRFRPELLVCDEHPDYFTTRSAREQATPVIAVQHHHAHIAAGMIEHGWLDREVLGIAWDGTGYGPDGTIWGGEFLVCTTQSYRRWARLRPFPLVGGEQAIRQPWRAAATVIADACGSTEAEAFLAAREVGNPAPFFQLLPQRRLSPLTASIGRLFDAAASIILGLSHVDYEGQAAMMLEAVADPSAAGEYPLVWSEGPLLEFDWRPMIAAVFMDHQRGVVPGDMAMRFHRTLATSVVQVCRRRPDLPVVLSGGVFQNRVLAELIAEHLADHPQPVGLPGRIPPNDGGLAAGQLAIAAARLRSST